MIKFKSVYKRQHNQDIFSGLDFFVKKNEKVLIQGKSGIGKTTLFKILLGFETIDRGDVLFNGLDITFEHIKTIRQQIFYLSQDIDLKSDVVNQLLDEIIEHGLIIDQDQAQRTIADLKDLFDLNDAIFNQTVNQLSGGERQRIGLLICFLLDRPVWLLDEPTSALDDTMKKNVADYILDKHKTIIIISHDNIWKSNKKIRIERWM